jgi:putative colanic acid biosynthesis UDP-glucose lipid carrier transferase
MHRSILKPHAPLFVSVLRASDPLAVFLVGLVAYRLYLGQFWPPEHYVLFLAAAVLTLVAIFPSFRLYDPQRGASLAGELRQLLLAWALMGALVGSTLFVTKLADAFSRVWVGLWLVGSFATTAGLRVAARVALRRLRRRGYNLRHVVIVGAGELGRVIAEQLGLAAWAGLNVVGFYDDDPAKHGTVVAGRPVLGSVDRLFDDSATTDVDQVWIALPLRAEARIRDILTALREHSLEVRLVPDIYGFHLLNHSLTDIAGLPVVSLTETPMSGINIVIKTVEDYALATLVLVCTAPLLLAVALGVKLSSPGPVLYRQERVTWKGERFAILKFRTMPIDVEDASGPVWSQRGERRATRFGTLLRRLSLDELPQLFNVLQGEMSLVGPRPERPEFVAQFRKEIPGYMQKHLVKAGITGWAQVNDLRGDSDLRKRIQFDLYYIENWSFWFDLRILTLTVWRVFQSRHAH